MENQPPSLSMTQQQDTPTRKDIARLWTMMAQLFGQPWVSSYGIEVDPLGVWTATLRGIPPDRIQAGFSRLVASGKKWPPSAPEFRAMCEPCPDDYGLPPLEEVSDRIISALCTYNTIPPEIFTRPVYSVWASVLDHRTLRLADERGQREIIKTAYNKVFQRIKSGGQFHEIPKGLPKKEHHALPREEAIQRMSRLKAMLNNEDESHDSQTDQH